MHVQSRPGTCRPLLMGAVSSLKIRDQHQASDRHPIVSKAPASPFLLQTEKDLSFTRNVLPFQKAFSRSAPRPLCTLSAICDRGALCNCTRLRSYFLGLPEAAVVRSVSRPQRDLVKICGYPKILMCYLQSLGTPFQVC